MISESILEGVYAARRYPDEVFWRYAMQREKLWNSLPPAEQASVIRGAASCGRQYAARRRARLSGGRVRNFCQKLGIRISDYESPESDTREVFALFEPPGTIWLRPELIDEVERSIQRHQLQEILGTFSLEDVMLAHEVFHYLEHRYRKTIYTKITKPAAMFVGPIRVHKRLDMLSEVGAMAFAKELLGLSWNPFLLDSVILAERSSGSSLAILSQLRELDDGTMEGM